VSDVVVRELVELPLRLTEIFVPEAVTCIEDVVPAELLIVVTEPPTDL
jgi:hypothetical protein